MATGTACAEGSSARTPHPPRGRWVVARGRDRELAILDGRRRHGIISQRGRCNETYITVATREQHGRRGPNSRSAPHLC